MAQFGLTPEILLVLSILFITMLLFVSDVIRVDIVAMLVVILLGVFQLLTPEQLFSGFSSEAVIALISIMIMSKGLEISGFTNRIARFILQSSRAYPYRIRLLIMLIPGCLSGFMRSFGTVGLFLPVINKISIRTSIARSKLLMPMAFCAMLGSSLTIVGSGPLIVLNSLLNNANLYATQQFEISLLPFKLFDVLPIGVALLAMGLVYSLVMIRFLPDKKRSFHSGTAKAQFLKTYGKGGDIFELKVQKNCGFIGRSLIYLESKHDPNFSIIAIKQGKDILFPPLRKTIIREGDFLAIMGSKENVLPFANDNKLKTYKTPNHFSEILHPARAGLCEVVVPPSSPLLGQKVRDLHMKRNYNLHVVALYRGTQVYYGEQLKDLTLHSGDTLGMYSDWEALSSLSENPDFVVVTTQYPKIETRRKEKLFPALFFFFLAIVLIISGHFPLSVSLLIGAAGMIGSGVLSVDEAYASVSWKTVFLLAGLIPLGLVLQTSGTVDWITAHLGYFEKNLSPWALQAAFAVFSTLLSLLVSNIGATVLLVPIAMDVAVNIGLDPRVFALTVALAASNTFLIPTHQVSALILGAGGYKVSDFIKFGSGLTLLYWIVMLIGLKGLFAD